MRGDLDVAPPGQRLASQEQARDPVGDVNVVCLIPARPSGANIEAANALQLMGGVSGVTLALRADHVYALAQGQGPSHVGHVKNGREDL
jgi:hypothetical protein